ncbi:MAG: DEAD/DEAH box helicase, partial [Bacteroidota bacterium]|nr:DEAD/DEAH box helicase [Bacteroidota bacterium]
MSNTTVNNRNKRQRNHSNSTRTRVQGSNNRNRNNARPAKKVSTLDPSLLVKEADHRVVDKVFRSDRLVSELPIDNKLKQALASKGYKRPTEIQDRTLEALLEGRDLLGIAQTGTGKTGAFLIPIIEHLLHKRMNP